MTSSNDPLLYHVPRYSEITWHPPAGSPSITTLLPARSPNILGGFPPGSPLFRAAPRLIALSTPPHTWWCRTPYALDSPLCSRWPLSLSAVRVPPCSRQPTRWVARLCSASREPLGRSDLVLAKKQIATLVAAGAVTRRNIAGSFSNADCPVIKWIIFH